MSSVEELGRLRARIERIATKIAKSRGEGYEYSYSFDDGTTTKYIVHDLKSHEDFEDQICTLLVWVWSMKDHIKAWASKHNFNPEMVEDAANGNRALAICADLANREKHPRPKWSRSSLWPSLGKVEFSVPLDNMKRLTFGSQFVELHIAKPELVKFRAPVLDGDGNNVGDAVEMLSRAMECWETLLSKLGASLQ